MHIETDTIANRLREAMSLRNMKQVDLVEKTKIPKSSINQYLSGYAEPKSDRVALLAEALDVSPVWLMGFPVDIDAKPVPYTEEQARIWVKIRHDFRTLELVKCYEQLTAEQQDSILNIVKSMVPPKAKSITTPYAEFSVQEPQDNLRRLVAYGEQLSTHPERSHKDNQ